MFSTNHELCHPIIQKFLSLHDINLDLVPADRPTKPGELKEKRRIKMVLDRLQKADLHPMTETVVRRASVFTNLIRGSKVFNAFQMTREFSPSLFGMPIKQYLGI